MFSFDLMATDEESVEEEDDSNQQQLKNHVFDNKTAKNKMKN